MRPLIYSEKKAAAKNIGWEREFQYGDDTCYLAHCYPYTFTDLRDDLDNMLADPERSKVMKRQVLCETRAGNSCFLVTVTNFDSDHTNKKAVIVTARVHPGETNSSWMMKGLLDYVTGSTITAKV
ncbi:hypothetical protein LSH36_117g04018 [Paralvinella palmiformis]|uniref:Peptidase M14 domain-containing protein n=1 Tax=Paralvinella palmiformis TaxID=53620 RepID=A0AAD9JYF7_9ANNE|nr:hypothetical protein LSH36_117g04018 [Paralvinella palmiformis]